MLIIPALEDHSENINICLMEKVCKAASILTNVYGNLSIVKFDKVSTAGKNVGMLTGTSPIVTCFPRLIQYRNSVSVPVQK